MSWHCLVEIGFLTWGGSFLTQSGDVQGGPAAAQVVRLGVATWSGVPNVRSVLRTDPARKTHEWKAYRTQTVAFSYPPRVRGLTDPASPEQGRICTVFV